MNAITKASDFHFQVGDTSLLRTRKLETLRKIIAGVNDNGWNYRLVENADMSVGSMAPAELPIVDIGKTFTIGSIGEVIQISAPTTRTIAMRAWMYLNEQSTLSATLKARVTRNAGSTSALSMGFFAYDVNDRFLGEVAVVTKDADWNTGDAWAVYRNDTDYATVKAAYPTAVHVRAFFRHTGGFATMQVATFDQAGVYGILDISAAVAAAEAAMDAAEAAALAAGGYAAVTLTYRDEAQGYASAAHADAVAAQSSNIAAGNSATAAAGSASSALTQADNAASSAASALSSATSASTDAGLASGYASNASTSASQASASATNASGSASTASTQAGLASTSATNASNSATAASNSASTASTQATNAGNSATASANSATSAGIQAGLASTHAGTASGYASSASDSAASALSYATLAASIGPGALNANPRFSTYATTPGEPASWVSWDYTGNGGAPTRVTGDLPGSYAVHEATGSGQNQGSRQGSTESSAMGNVKSSDYFVLEASVKLVSGTLQGAGMHLQYRNSGGTTIDSDSFNFYTEKDSTDTVIGAGTTGKTYHFSKLVQSTTANITNLMLYRMTGWTGFGTVAAKTLEWQKCLVRPATAQEIAAGVALPALKATVTTQAGTLATHDGKLVAWLEEVVAAGSSVAALRLKSDNHLGSYLELQADAIRLGSANLAAMDVVGSTVYFRGKVNANSITSTELSTGLLITSAAQIGTGVITSAKIGNLQVKTANFDNLSINKAKIIPGEIGLVTNYFAPDTAVGATGSYNGSGTFTGGHVIFDTPFYAVSDASLGAVQATLYATFDGYTYGPDGSSQLWLVADTGSGYGPSKYQMCGIATTSGNTYASMPIAVTFGLSGVQNVRYRLFAAQNSFPGGSGNPTVIRNINLAITGLAR